MRNSCDSEGSILPVGGERSRDGGSVVVVEVLWRGRDYMTVVVEGILIYSSLLSSNDVKYADC
jgi:hypothetical protein